MKKLRAFVIVPILLLVGISCKNNSKVYLNNLNSEKERDCSISADVKSILYRSYSYHRIQDNKIVDLSDCYVLGPTEYNKAGSLIKYVSEYSVTEYDDYGRTTREKNYLHGNSEEYIDKHYHYEDRGTSCWVNKYITEKKKGPSGEININSETKEYKYWEYNKQGRVAREYFDNGNLSIKWVEEKDKLVCYDYSYDSPSQIIEKTSYDWQGNLLSNYEYDDGKEISHTVWTYSKTASGDLLTVRKTYSHSSDKESIEKEEKYFHPGSSSSYKRIIKDGDNNFIEEALYEYDDHNMLVKASKRTSDSFYYWQICDFFYDKKGNWIMKLEYSDTDKKQIRLIAIREITYYDGTDSKEELAKLVNPYIAPHKQDKPHSSSSQENSSADTKNVVVQHHGATSVWVQCGACGGSGMCQTCGGTGWGSMSDGSCISCGYSGKCSYCAGHGGHNEIRYY